jgi:hypothetical protein
MARPAGAAVLALLAVVATAREAFAQHHHGAPTSSSSSVAPFRAGLTAIAAQFDTRLYAGDYQGLAVALEWRHGRVGVHAGVPFYRLQENGLTHLGPGDVGLGGDVTALARAPWRAGASLGVTLPTRDPQESLGMGHPMLMPGAWVSIGGGRAVVAAALGYGRALASLDGHDHGGGPLVEPMNGQEVTGELRGELSPWRPSLRTAARLAAAMPAGVDGTARGLAAVGGAWHGGRIDTTIELQLGLFGDPFTVRALVETAVRF